MFKVGDKVRRKEKNQKGFWWKIICRDRRLDLTASLTVVKIENGEIYLKELEGEFFDVNFFEKAPSSRPTSHYFPKEL